jgi:hypothetical protein
MEMTQEKSPRMQIPSENKLLSQLDDYTCVDPELGDFVFDYFNGLLTGDQKQEFEEHLSICLECEETLGKMAWLSKHSVVTEQAASISHAVGTQRKNI